MVVPARTLLRLVVAGLACAIAAACGRGGPAPIADPIPDLPLTQQRAVERTDFDHQWPFSVGKGTLGCAAGALLFRHEGKTYALDEAAESRGFARLDPIWRYQGSGWPKNPLTRLEQRKREEIFAVAMACGDGPLSAEREVETLACRQRLRQVSEITDAELTQIEAEGRERFWRPLAQPRASLDPLRAAGRALCTA